MNNLLDNKIQYAIDNELIPCAYYALIDNENVVMKYKGCKQIKPKKILLEENDIYDLASLSKVVGTTTGILKLIEEGKINYATKISQILKEFKHKEVTIQNLLTHTSGLPSDMDYSKIKNKRELIDELYKQELAYKNGTNVLYSDLGFILLGLVIEKITGSIKNYLHENVFLPLHMKYTGYNCPDSLKARCVTTELKKDRGYVKGTVHDGKAYLMGGESGHAGLFSTCSDLVNFVMMVINEGSFERKKILSKETIQKFKINFTADINKVNPDTECRTLGWKLLKIENQNYMYHTGFTGTSILIDLKGRKAFILLTNRIHPSREDKGFLKFRNNLNNYVVTEIWNKNKEEDK